MLVTKNLAPLTMRQMFVCMVFLFVTLFIVACDKSADPSKSNSAVTKIDSSFVVPETSIAKVHAAFKAGSLSCLQLVNAYIQRIEQYDKPKDESKNKANTLNSIVFICQGL